MRRVVRAGSPEVLKISDSSTSFREHDDVFLQTQTRIWLGEVLHIRFDEETSIADLLADGELLFQLSKVVWKMLLKKYVELKHSKVYIYERTSSGKSDGRYMPYPKVDSFLKICQILGLTGVDLFSPSDVVEKRDVRRVCMCIRSLSKKARSKHLDVPDFDIVTYTVAMPTDLVDGILRNLEQSQCSSSSSSGFSSPCMDSRERYRQKNPGGQHAWHYDSYSESDEAESTFTEFEFQSPLSNASFDAVNLSNVMGENSPEGNYPADGNLLELQNGFHLDSHDGNEDGHMSTTEHGNHEFTVGLYSKSSSFRTKCQIDRGARACFTDMREVIWPLSNPKFHQESYNVSGGHYQNFASTCEDSSHELDETLAVNAEAAFRSLGPMHSSEGLENILPRCSSADSNINFDHPKEEFMKPSVGPSGQAQTVSCRMGYDCVRSEYMEENSNNGNIVGFRDTVHEILPLKKSIVNVERKKDHSSINTLKIDASNFFEKVSLPANYIGLQPGTSDLILHSIGDGNFVVSDPDVPSSSFSLSKGTVDSDWKCIENGLKRKAVDHEVVDAEVYSTVNLLSSEDKFGDNDCTANSFSFPQIHNLREVELCKSTFEISASAHVSSVEEEGMKTKLHDMDLNDDRELFTAEEYRLSVEIDGIGRRSITGSQSLIDLSDSFTCDNEATHSFRETEDMTSTRNFSSTTDEKSMYLGVPNVSPLDIDCSIVSCVDSALLKDDQVIPSQSDSHCNIWNTQCKNDSFSSTTVSDKCNGNVLKYTPSSIISSTRSGRTSGEGDYKGASTCDHEMDANEQPSNSIMSSTQEYIIDNNFSIGERRVYSSTTLNSFESQSCNSETERELKMEGCELKDVSYHPCETYKDLLVEVRKNDTEKLCIENISNSDTWSESATCTNIFEYIKCCSALSETDGDAQSCMSSFHIEESCVTQKKFLPLGSDIVEREALLIPGPHHMDENEIHGLETEGINSPGDLNIVCTRGSNVVNRIESTDINNVTLKEVSNDQASTHDPVDHDCISYTRSSTDFKDDCMQGDKILLSGSTPACIMEREICTEETNDRKSRGVIPLVDDVSTIMMHEEAVHTRNRKDTEVRKPVNKVLQSVAGAISLVGALFLFNHIRQKRVKEKNSKIVAPQQIHSSRQEVSTKKRLETGKSDVLYPGERLKF